MTDKSPAEYLFIAYSTRPCFICAMIGCCRHREPWVELAYLEAANRKPASELRVVRRQKSGGAK